jgi:hypothetical protein
MNESRYDSQQVLSLDGQQGYVMTGAPSMQTGSAPRKTTADDERLAAQRRKIKRAIVAVALLLIVASVLLVAGMLSMSAHIDDMGG